MQLDTWCCWMLQCYSFTPCSAPPKVQQRCFTKPNCSPQPRSSRALAVVEFSNVVMKKWKTTMGNRGLKWSKLIDYTNHYWDWDELTNCEHMENMETWNSQFDLRTCSFQTSWRYEQTEEKTWLGGRGPSWNPNVQTIRPRNLFALWDAQHWLERNLPQSLRAFSNNGQRNLRALVSSTFSTTFSKIFSPILAPIVGLSPHPRIFTPPDCNWIAIDHWKRKLSSTYWCLVGNGGTIYNNIY